MEPPALKLPALPFTPVHWDALPATEHKGEAGKFDKYFSADPGAGD